MTNGEEYLYDFIPTATDAFDDSDTVIREYRWDQQNRLVRMLTGTHESVYEYDGQSRRIRITEKENGVQTKQETFVWCGARICQKRNDATVVRSYFGQGFEQGSECYFYTRDHLGSVRELVASDGTTVGSRLSYDLWGKVTETGSALSDFAYTGHHYDRPTELSLAWYRGYDPNLGRWLSKDPIGIRGGLNVYAYVANDPTNWTDATGLHPKDKLFGLSRKFWKWVHRPGGELKDRSTDLEKDEAMGLFEEWKRLGKPGPDNKGRPRDPDTDISDLLEFFLPPVIMCLLNPMFCGPGESPQCI